MSQITPHVVNINNGKPHCSGVGGLEGAPYYTEETVNPRKES